MLTGDCYEAAFTEMMRRYADGTGDGSLLMHAEVMGQGQIEGVQYGHAFVVDGSLVIDKSNGRNIRMPKAFYYAIGKIEEIDNNISYTYEEMVEKARKYEHYGPWDLKTSTGL